MDAELMVCLSDVVNFYKVLTVNGVKITIFEPKLFILRFLTLLHTTPIYSWEMQGGADSVPPCLIFLKWVFGVFYETTLEQYMIVGPMPKETVRSSKLRILSPFEKSSSIFWKNPVAIEKFITQSNLNRFYSSFLQTSSFCKYKTILQ